MKIEGLPMLGTHHDLVRLAQELRADEIIVAITNSQTIHDDLFQAIIDCRELGIAITTMPMLYEYLMGRVPVEHAGQDLYVVMPLSQSATHRLYMSVRRVMDILISLLGLLLLLLVMPFVWLANRACSPGCLFYWQARVGEGGKLFHLVKFRSMVMNAEE
jgi:hypothetical protein